MRYIYSKNHQNFDLTASDNILYEANIGVDPGYLYFPGVSSCTVLMILLNDDALLGAHFDKLLSNFDVYQMLWWMSQLKAARHVVRMVVAGNSTCEQATRSFMSKGDFRQGRDLTTFAEAFDYQSPGAQALPGPGGEEALPSAGPGGGDAGLFGRRGLRERRAGTLRPATRRLDDQPAA